MRASIFDIPVIAVVTLITAFMIILFYTFFLTFQTFVNTQPDMPIEAKNAMVQMNDACKLLDMGLAIIFLALSITTLLLARSIPTHPMNFFLGVIAMIIFVFICKLLSDIYIEFVSNALLVTAANAFPIIGYIMTNLVFWVIGMFVLITLMMYTGGDNSNVASYQY